MFRFNTRKEIADAKRKQNGDNNNETMTTFEEKSSHFWKGLAVQENLRKIFKAPLPVNLLTPLNGFRAITTAWIVFSHMVFFSLGPTQNIQFMFNNNGAWGLQPFLAVIIVVDVFFVIAAFLMSYNFFEELKKRKPESLVRSTAKKIFMRYFRLAPCFMVVSTCWKDKWSHCHQIKVSFISQTLIVSAVIGMYLNDTSQFIPYELLEDNCKKYWWRNLLMIHNWFEPLEMCMSWSWYVAVDFQLFAVSSVLLALSVVWVGCALVSSVIMKFFMFQKQETQRRPRKFDSCAVFSLLRIFGISPSVQLYVSSAKFAALPLDPNSRCRSDSMFKSVGILYLRTYTRSGTYFCGVISGYYLSAIDRKWNVAKVRWFVSRIFKFSLCIHSERRTSAGLCRLQSFCAWHLSWNSGEKTAWPLLCCSRHSGEFCMQLQSVSCFWPHQHNMTTVIDDSPYKH